MRREGGTVTENCEGGWVFWCRKLMGWLKPDFWCESLDCVPLEKLWNDGVRLLFVDLDNTLTEAGGEWVSEPICAWIEKAKAKGFTIIVVSNALGPVRVSRVSEQLGVVGIPLAAKPRRFAFLRCLQILGYHPSQAAMIGDQLFTDILGGKRAGLKTILIKPLGKRVLSGQIQASFERLIVVLMRRYGGENPGESREL
ncbi:MAG: YqeG family HAD IIIA-type phosphatase [Armatimonadetes bacterium]|nr:YqeG family HAD IIIA-type phosphatase [Armatimonadota bacterium]MDW8123102.1 YqeG family HAD IIIA-type phosphatase [Armatimonadota bacterium]